MKLPRSIIAGALGAGIAACIVALAAGPARAAGHAASQNLTPYRLVSADGMCLAVATSAPVAGADLGLSMRHCDDAPARETFYLLKAGQDADAVAQLGAQAVRIALVDGFDSVLQPAYQLMRVPAQGSAVPVGVTSQSLSGAPAEAVFTLDHVPQAQGQWVPVGGNPQATFGVAGKRFVRYGSSANGLYAYRSLEGLELAATGQCADAFFPSLPPADGKACAVQDLQRSATPMHVQIRGPQAGTCLSRSGEGTRATVVMGSCSPGTTDNVWALRPGAYLH